MPTKPDHHEIAASLAGGEPLDFKRYPDGGLVVIAPDGQKLHFTARQVTAAAAKLKRAAVSKPSRASKLAGTE